MTEHKTVTISQGERDLCAIFDTTHTKSGTINIDVNHLVAMYGANSPFARNNGFDYVRPWLAPAGPGSTYMPKSRIGPETLQASNLVAQGMKFSPEIPPVQADLMARCHSMSWDFDLQSC